MGFSHELIANSIALINLLFVVGLLIKSSSRKTGESEANLKSLELQFKQCKDNCSARYDNFMAELSRIARKEEDIITWQAERPQFLDAFYVRREVFDLTFKTIEQRLARIEAAVGTEGK